MVEVVVEGGGGVVGGGVGCSKKASFGVSRV